MITLFLVFFFSLFVFFLNGFVFYCNFSFLLQDFSQVYPSFDLARVNTLELAMLDALKYVIRVPASEYAKYYFHLRSMMVKLGVTKDDPNFIKPLNIDGARRLQLSTERFHDAYHEINGDHLESSGAGDDEEDHNNNNNNGNNFLVGRRRHMSLHEGLSTLQRDPTESHVPTVSIEQIIHAEHMDADGVVHTGLSSAKKKSQHGMHVSPPRK